MAERPNFLFVFDDQHRYDYLGAAGAAWIDTPNLDRIAARGMRFTQCAVNAPVCAASRMALATGLSPIRAGVLMNGFGKAAHDTPTFYQRLRDHGYWVASTGKLHLGPLGAAGPHGQPPGAYRLGFTHPHDCEGKMAAGYQRKANGPYSHYLQELGLLDDFIDDYQKRIEVGWGHANWDSVLPTEAFADAFIGRYATEWIADVPDVNPWFMVVNFVGPHSPFDPPREYADKYRDREMPKAIPRIEDGKPQWILDRDLGLSPQAVTEAQRQYCAAIEAIDDQVGTMLDALEHRGMLDNTLIVFSSDHGEMLGDFGMFAKYVPCEAALRVPLLVAGPGIEPGQVSNALVELIDINATICELAGMPAQEHIDAQSFAPVLCGEAAEHRTETASLLDNFRCIRNRDYKFIENYNDICELYDLRQDPGERNNIADEMPAVREEMRGRLSERFFGGRKAPAGMPIKL